MTESAETPDDYSKMFTEYLNQNPWATSAEHMLFVFHVRSLCRRLDEDGLGNAAMSGAYLNAIRALENRRGDGKKAAGSDPDQVDIFDFLD